MPTDLEQRFANTAARLGLGDEAKLKRDMAAAEAIRERGVYADLRTVLVGRRKMSDDDAEDVLREMGQVVVFCPVCNGCYQMGSYDPAQHCPRDNSPLKVTLAPDHLPDKKKTRPVEKARAFGTRTVEKPSSDPLVGRMIAGVRILELVDDEDPYVRTYTCRLPKSDVPLEFKVLKSKDEMAIKRFLRGARYASLINHPNVIGVVASGELDGRAWVVTEHLPGTTVEKMITGAPNHQLELSLSVKIAIAVLSGLDAAHQIGVVHRNIKPGNIAIDNEGNTICIIGFDKARILDPQQESEKLTAQGSSLGTPHYMAPEQVQSSQVDYRADLYAFGATLYHMLGGRPPHDGAQMLDVIQAKMTKDPVPLSQLNPKVNATLEHIVATLLSRDPDGRYPTATHAAVSLKSLSM